MPTELERHKYPGLNASSVELWRKWLGFYQDTFSSYDYNVRVGQGITPPAHLSDDEKQMWKMLTQKRIDVVAERYDSHWIIEIVERPGLYSVGQVVGYEKLGRKYLNITKPVRVGLICARLGHDMAGIFRELGIFVFFFPPGKPPSFPPTFKPTMPKNP